MIARAAIALLAVLTLGVGLPLTTLAASQTVTIQDFNFTPQSVTVNVGDSVTWRNTGAENHTATSNSTGFDTGVLGPGASKTIVFGTAGTFDYHCAIHTSMRGTVTVLAAVATPPPPTPPATVVPTPPPTVVPTPPPTIPPTAPPATPAPTAAPSTTAPASSAPPASATASIVPTASSSPIASVVATASPSASVAAVPAPVPSGDAGPLPLVIGAVVLAGIAGVALFALRRR